MTNFELMALEHAASFAYTAATLATKRGTEADIIFTAADRANSKLTLNYDAKTVRFSLTEYDDAGSEKFLMWHTSRNTTECLQMLDKFRKNIEIAHIDFASLCEPFRVKPQAAVVDNEKGSLWGAHTAKEETIKDKAEAIAKTPLIRFDDASMRDLLDFKGHGADHHNPVMYEGVAVCPPPAPMPDMNVYSTPMPPTPAMPPKHKGDDE